ncbi:MAG: CoA transferase subunit A [Alphaproteobacteria bacterium]
MALGGWSFTRRPIGAVRGIVAAGLRFEELVTIAGGLETDLMLCAGAVDRLRGFYFGMEALGNGPGLRQGAEIVEESEGSLVLGLTAAAQGQTFLPLHAEHGAALAKLRPDIKRIDCPYTGHAYLAMPAIKPDVAILHARVADRRGNAILGGNLGADRLLATAAAHTIVTCDELVDGIGGDGSEADIAGLMVDAVVHLPGGAAPTSCRPLYESDWDALIAYTELTPDGALAWLDEVAPSGGTL